MAHIIWMYRGEADLKHVITDRIRLDVLSNLRDKYKLEGVLAACNHCIDDLVANRMTIDCDSSADVIREVVLLVESMVEVADEFS